MQHKKPGLIHYRRILCEVSVFFLNASCEILTHKFVIKRLTDKNDTLHFDHKLKKEKQSIYVISL